MKADSLNAQALKRIDEDRVARGVCRHCGGPLPCWSPSGDARPGVRNPRPPRKRHRKEAS